MHTHRYLLEIDNDEEAGYKVGCIQEALTFMGLPFSVEYEPGAGFMFDITFPEGSLLETFTGLDGNLPA